MVDPGSECVSRGHQSPWLYIICPLLCSALGGYINMSVFEAEESSETGISPLEMVQSTFVCQ